MPRGFALAGDPLTDVTVQPTGLITGGAAERAIEAGFALPIAGGPVAFTTAVVMLREDGRLLRTLAALDAVRDWAAGEATPVGDAVAACLDRISRPRAAFAGLMLDCARLMGVVNVTPDSFSDGGDRFDPGAAIAAGRALADAGADLIDIGGESTRPGAEPVSPEHEAERILPVIAALAAEGIAVSVDTRRASVMAAALDAGARVVNDVTALTDDPDAPEVIRASEARAILMHMQGDPRTMQDAPRYADAPFEVFAFLQARTAALEAFGLEASTLAVDPGIGFGKDDAHNASILASIGLLHATGAPVVLGASRKSFIGRMSRGEPPKARLAGSLAAVAGAAMQGVQIFRVHDVAETRQALSILARLGAVGVT